MPSHLVVIFLSDLYFTLYDQYLTYPFNKILSQTGGRWTYIGLEGETGRHISVSKGGKVGASDNKSLQLCSHAKVCTGSMWTEQN